MNALIRKFPDIETAHYKLWIASSAVLSNFLNAAIYNVSQHVASEAMSKSRYYALTSSHLEAKEKLENSNVLVITGEPGVGKTTLAEQICLEFIAQKYELIVIKNDIEEGFSVVRPGEKQIFYFDDFLGRNYIETLRFNEDARIMQFVNLISLSNNKKFILTSRANILDQGYLLGQSFIHDKLKNKEFILDVSCYDFEDKAKILYSFLWKSDLKRQYIEKIIQKRRYYNIIHHQNYNPRLLEFITTNEYVQDHHPEQYIKYIDSSLRNPKNIWNHPYTVQLDAASRIIVDMIVFSNGEIEETALQSAYHSYSSKNKFSIKSNVAKDFDSIMETLSRSFIRRNMNTREGRITYSTFNPSISDFILAKYAKNFPHIAEILSQYPADEGLLFLEKIKSSNCKLTQNVSKILLEHIGFQLDKNNALYTMRLANLLELRMFEKHFSEISLSQLLLHISSIGWADSSRKCNTPGVG